MNSPLEEMLSKANTEREAENFSESAKIYTECLQKAADTNDSEALIHCLGGQSLIYKILTRKDNNPIYRHLTLAFAKEAYEIGEREKDVIDGRTLSIAYSSYADALLMDGQIKESLPFFEKSLAVSTAEIPEKGRLKAHIGGVKFLLGEKNKGAALITEALTDIRTGDMNSYNIRVWETGCLNGLAKGEMIEGHKEKALSIIDESLKISVDHNLPIRKREAEEIKEKILADKTDFSL